MRIYESGPAWTRTRDLFLIRDSCMCCGCSPLFQNTCKSLLFDSTSVLHVHCCSGALSSNCRQSRCRDQRGFVQAAVLQHLRAHAGDAQARDKTGLLQQLAVKLRHLRSVFIEAFLVDLRTKVVESVRRDSSTTRLEPATVSLQVINLLLHAIFQTISP